MSDKKYGYDQKQKSIYEKMQKGSGIKPVEESLDERMRKRLERLLGIGKKEETKTKEQE